MYTQEDYRPEDFSQEAINRGQRKINYALTTVDVKLIRVLEELKNAIATGPGGNKVDFAAVDAAISEAAKTSKRVAEIKPPGCDTTWN